MMLTKYQNEVDQLSRRAGALSVAAAERQDWFMRWKHKTLSSPESLAWIFAAGAAWGVIRGVDTGKTKSKRVVFGAANLGLLGWRFLNRVDDV